MAATIVIDLKQRPWASRREFQRFLGPYRLDKTSGLYFSDETDPGCQRRLAAAFASLPAGMLALCRAYSLTVSTSAGFTASGNHSTFYADFSKALGQGLSPHIEMGSVSLTAPLILPHLTHEAAHLWWRSLPAEAREAYTAFLVNTCVHKGGVVEVSDYVAEKLTQYLRSLAIPDTESYAENHRLVYRQHWVEESFCDTVAVLHVPAYPSYKRESTVDLQSRRKAIAEIAALRLA